MRVHAISRPAFAAGLTLAGLGVTAVDDDAEAVEAVRRFAGDAETGIVLVEETLYRALPRELLAHLERHALPVVVPIPQPRCDERSEAESHILEILRQAIGYRVRPR